MYRTDGLTAASRIMLPVYVIWDAMWALVFITDPENRLSKAPSLTYARDLLPLETWGVLWGVLAVAMLVALYLPAIRNVVTAALAINSASWLAWAYVVQQSVGENPNVSYLSGSLPVFVAVASFASMTSLMRNESDRDR